MPSYPCTSENLKVASGEREGTAIFFGPGSGLQTKEDWPDAITSRAKAERDAIDKAHDEAMASLPAHTCEDDCERGKEEVQTLLKRFEDKIQEMADKKSKEIMEQ